MSDVPQIVAENAMSTSAMEHHVMDILNPSLHHHDLLQSYVRVEVCSDSKDPQEFEEPCKEVHSSKHLTALSGDKARYAHDKGKKGKDRKEKQSPDTAIESEMRIQKSKRK
ncbi:hypothetical protein ALC53_03880 [Atta colombica]|uniref:Uncharacterized protein n=1 Tax=Atta colombica TaxID=520822 RepID=A0A195BN27_9HYME|nr:hypothetical protein ALC53_03880 [Atta colombica]